MLLVILLLTGGLAPANAQKEVRTYYDPQKEHLQEIYFVEADNETYTGRYQRYYESGGLMVDGNFSDGKKSGDFIECHENGKQARILTYVSGLRHGPVKVYNEDGAPAPQALMQ